MHVPKAEDAGMQGAAHQACVSMPKSLFVSVGGRGFKTCWLLLETLYFKYYGLVDTLHGYCEQCLLFRFVTGAAILGRFFENDLILGAVFPPTIILLYVGDSRAVFPP